MKRLWFVLIMVIITLCISPLKVNAERLVCDIPSDASNIVACQVNIDGAIVPGVMDTGAIRIYTDQTGSYMELLDEATMASLESGRHTFTARLQDASGWWSDWSTPLDAGKPANPGAVKVK